MRAGTEPEHALLRDRDICLQYSSHLQGPLQLCKGLLPLRLGGAFCSWRDPRAPRWHGLSRRRGAAPCQRIAQVPRIKQQLQHALLRDCPVQRAAQLQYFPAATNCLRCQTSDISDASP